MNIHSFAAEYLMFDYRMQPRLQDIMYYMADVSYYIKSEKRIEMHLVPRPLDKRDYRDLDFIQEAERH